jgi:bifunctional DNase/RNase
MQLYKHKIFTLTNGMNINQEQDPDYESVKIDYVGFVDPYAVEGMIVLKASEGKEFHMRAFSGEVAKHISSFSESSEDTVPSIYKMIEDICEQNEIVLVNVKIYESGEVLRANLYFTGKKDMVLRNYRASDAVALGAFYKIPILVRKNLLKTSMEV